MKKHPKYPEFGRRFITLFQEGETQEEFGARVGIGRNTIAQYCRGGSMPDSQHLIQICERCHVSADWLLGLSDVKKPAADLRAVSEYTKLSEKAINGLKDLSDRNTISVLDQILASEQTLDVFQVLLVKVLYACYLNYLEPGESYTIGLSEKDVAYYECSKYLDTLIKTICKEYPELKEMASSKNLDEFFFIFDATRKAIGAALNEIGITEEGNEKENALH